MMAKGMIAKVDAPPMVEAQALEVNLPGPLLTRAGAGGPQP